MKPIISKNIRLRVPQHFKVGNNSIIDDFCYFSTKVDIGEHVHIANGCSIAGGKAFTFTMKGYASLSSGVKVWCSSNDYVTDPIVLGYSSITGDVTLDKYTGVGSNSVIMPNNYIPAGTVIGALSFVPPNFKFKKWAVYAGIPVRYIKDRDRGAVLSNFSNDYEGREKPAPTLQSIHHYEGRV